jgi:hypothetical protein
MRAPRKPVLITCPVCVRDHVHHGAHGWCRSCYGRWLRADRPTDGPPPPGSTPAPVDELTVDAAVAGLRPTLSPRERRAAIARLRDRGMQPRAMADRLGCSDRTVARHLAALKNGA